MQLAAGDIDSSHLFFPFLKGDFFAASLCAKHDGTMDDRMPYPAANMYHICYIHQHRCNKAEAKGE